MYMLTCDLFEVDNLLVQNMSLPVSSTNAGKYHLKMYILNVHGQYGHKLYNTVNSVVDFFICAL